MEPWRGSFWKGLWEDVKLLLILAASLVTLAAAAMALRFLVLGRL